MSSAFDKAEINIVMPKSNNIDENAFITSVGKSKSGTVVSFDDGEGGSPVKDLTLDIESVQDLHGYDHPWVGGAGKNLFNYEDVYSLSNLANNNGTFVSTDTDTRTSFALTVQQYNGSTYVKSNNLNISESGRYYLPITIDSAITSLRIKHNGASKEFRFNYPFAKEGTFCFSLEVTSADPTVVGGVSFKNVMIESGSTMTDYSPYSNICPISGWDKAEIYVKGKNLCPPLLSATSNGITFTANDDGSMTVTGTATGEALSGGGRGTGRLAVFPLLKVGTYILSGNNCLRFYCNALNKDGTNATISNLGGQSLSNFSLTPNNTQYTFIVSTPCCVIVRVDVLNGETTNKTCYPMIRLASDTDDAYEPYNGNTYTVNLNDTCYGGTLDVTTGVLTVTHRYLEVSSCNSVDIASTNVQYAKIGLGSGNGANSDHSTNISSSYEQTESAPQTDGYFRLSGSTLYIYDNRFTDKATADAVLASELPQVVYKLATPQTIQLSSTKVQTVFGENNIWSDSGDVEVTYGLTKEIIVKIQLLL